MVYVAQKGDKLGDLVKTGGDIDEVKFISGGKWRRYHGEGWRQFLDVATLAKNIRDFFRLVIGTLQSVYLLRRLKPDGVFIKGAYVGVPVGWAASWRHVPYVTLDLDAMPSLANRLIAKRAAAHGVALPKEAYPYPPDKTYYVGVPIADDFKPVSPKLQADYKKALGLAAHTQVILVIGGGLGAERLNTAVAKLVPALLERYPDATIIHGVGRDHEKKMSHAYSESILGKDSSRIIVKGFIEDMYRYSGAADIIISRAGAASLAEFAAQAKACIIVPNPLLTGGHQLKNADQLAAHQAIRVVHESELSNEDHGLFAVLCELLESPQQRAQLGATLHSFARNDAAKNLARILLQLFTKKRDEDLAN